jgi:hypothetical protein
MTATIAAPLSVPTHKAQRRKAYPPTRSYRARTSRDVLGRYTDSSARSREIVAVAGAGGSLLVIDRDALTFGDRHLVAHLAPDEPTVNARVIGGQYLADLGSRRCRPVTSADLRAIPDPENDGAHPQAPEGNLLVDRHGHSYHLQRVRADRLSIPEMRWQQYPPEGQAGPPRVMRVRDVIAALESYEPVRTLTRKTLARHRLDADLSVSVLRDETDRVGASRIVLNRGLREAVLSSVQASGVSMSEIAMRCGRLKYDSRGNASGETSWLSRRLGLTPEGGQATPTPWIHSEVLARIARRGLGISPREVELG